MSRTIWKWTLDITDAQTLVIPVGTKFIDTKLQFGKIAVWGIVPEPANPNAETVKFVIVGTGHHMTDDPTLNYLGTVPMAEGQLVWHVFTTGAVE